MKVAVNKNIDDYKDDFFKGLTFYQTVMSVLALVSGTAVFFICFGMFGIPQSVSLYLALPAAFIFAASGFLKIDGMAPITYLKKRLYCIRNPLYVSVPDVLADLEERDKNTTEKERKIKGGLLETEEELEKRMEEYGIYEGNGKI